MNFWRDTIRMTVIHIRSSWRSNFYLGQRLRPIFWADINGCGWLGMHRYWLGSDIIQILMLLETCTGQKFIGRRIWATHTMTANTDTRKGLKNLFQDNETVQDVRLETSSPWIRRRLSSGEGQYDNDMASSERTRTCILFCKRYHIAVSEHCKQALMNKQ